MKTILSDPASNRQYPFLVYGTLRPGCGNYRGFLMGRTESEETVQVNGFRMYGRTAFPYLVATGGEDDVVTCTLIKVPGSLYGQVLRELDSLEGFYTVGSTLNHYDRKLATFTVNGFLTCAWVYVASADVAREVVKETPLILSGDWLQHKAETDLRYSFS